MRKCRGAIKKILAIPVRVLRPIVVKMMSPPGSPSLNSGGLTIVGDSQFKNYCISSLDVLRSSTGDFPPSISQGWLIFQSGEKSVFCSPIKVLGIGDGWTAAGSDGVLMLLSYVVLVRHLLWEQGMQTKEARVTAYNASFKLLNGRPGADSLLEHMKRWAMRW